MKKKKKKSKKVFALVAVAAAVSAVVLGACAKKKADENTESGDVASESAGAGEENATATQEAKDELTALLDRAQRDVQPGTAGCSLKATVVAVELLRWGEKNPMSAAEAKKVTEEFITAQGSEYFAESIALVDEACTDLQSSEALGILEDIGMSLTDKTWGNEPLPAVEAVMEAAGLR